MLRSPSSAVRARAAVPDTFTARLTMANEMVVAVDEVLSVLDWLEGDTGGLQSNLDTAWLHDARRAGRGGTVRLHCVFATARLQARRRR